MVIRKRNVCSGCGSLDVRRRTRLGKYACGRCSWEGEVPLVRDVCCTTRDGGGADLFIYSEGLWLKV